MLPSLIAVVGTIVVLLAPLSAFAENHGSGSSTFKVNVYGSGINQDTGRLDVSVRLENGATESDIVSPSGTGSQFLTQFVFGRGESDVGESFRACITPSNGERICNSGVNSPKNAPEDITVFVSDSESGFSDSSFEIVQEHDFDNEQDANCNITGDNNSCEINQENSFSDTIRDIGDSIEQIFDN